MREIRSGREQKKIMPVNTQKKNFKESERKNRAADGAAIICAVLCAACLCFFGAGGDALSKDAAYQPVGSGALGAVTYTPPKQSDEWSFWDYFADVMAGVFGYNG